MLGCIADDFTGATGLASMLARGCMRTVQAIGVPTAAIDAADAVVVALKSRTIAPEAAVAQSLAALRWLQQAGCRQLLSESGMHDHPLTPMVDANLVCVLQAQSRRRVGLVPHTTVARGAAAIETALEDLAGGGAGLAIVDAVADADLMQIGAACRLHNFAAAELGGRNPVCA